MSSETLPLVDFSLIGSLFGRFGRMRCAGYDISILHVYVLQTSSCD
jgi:hypothetical protein